MIITERLSFKEAVRTAARLALPAGDVLLRPREGGGIVVTATDLEQRIEIVADGELNEAIVVPAVLLSEMITAVGREVYRLKAERSVLHIETEALSLRLGGSSDPRDFPPTPPDVVEDMAEEIPFDSDAFRWASKVCATDDSRPILQGVCINPETGAMFASDGFRLRCAGEPWEINGREVVIPGVAAMNLPRTCAGAWAGDTQVRIEGAEWTLTVRRTQGTPPSFEAMIPKETLWRLDGCDRATWLKALAPVQAATEPGEGIVRIRGGDGSVKFSGRTEALAEAEARITVPDCPDFRVALNAAFLTHALSGVGPSFSISGNDPVLPVLIESGDRRDLIMPMLVEWEQDA